MIEVWEKLDCENVGRAEIEAIEVVLSDRFGAAAVDPPMTIARLLADEGAELRHAEIMELYVERASERPYDAAFRGVLNLNDMTSAASSIRRLENLRRKYLSENDRHGLHLVVATGRRAKKMLEEKVAALSGNDRETNVEMAQWFTIWLQTPEIFENWLHLRTGSVDFTDKFGAFE